MPPSPKMNSFKLASKMNNGPSRGTVFALVAFIITAGLLSASVYSNKQYPSLVARTDNTPHFLYATATLHPDADPNVNGTLHFVQDTSSGTVKITGEIHGLVPNALRGFHVHEFGDISSGCASTGSHYNPTNSTHGAPTDAVRHVGDLGNVQSDENGVAVLDFEDSVISLQGAWNIVGRAMVVHVGTDDLGRGGNENSTTTGNSGARAACGVIGLAKPTA